MSRFARRVDGTHAEIRDGLRKVGCSVWDTHDLGNDFGDLVVGLAGETYILEVKTPKAILGRKANETAGQRRARQGWRGGAWLVVESLPQALSLLGLTRKLEAGP